MESAVSVFDLRLPPYTPALFLARCAATFVAYPAQNLIAWKSLQPDLAFAKEYLPEAKTTRT